MAKVIELGLRPTLDVENMAITMEVKKADGPVIASKVFNWDEIPSENRARLGLHGFSTILQQRCSQIKADPIAKLDAMEEVYDLLKTGGWEKERASGPRVFPAILEVLAKLKGKPAGVIQPAFNALSEEQKAALRAKYASEVAAVEAARLAAEPEDLSDLL
jgi:hypothetical protein